MKRLLNMFRAWLLSGLREELRQQTLLLAYTSLDRGTIRFHHRDEEVFLYIPDAITDLLQNDIMAKRTFYEGALLDRVDDTYGLKGAHIVDVGANIGNHTVYFSKVAKAASCHAFEPNPYSARLLRRNVEINGLGGVELHELALGALDGRLSVYQRETGNLGGTSYRVDADGSFPAIPLDSLALSSVDFIKIDVEGMADQVIRGAADTLRKHRPVVFVELFDYERADAVRLLSALNYRQTVDLGRFNYIFEAGA